MIAAAKGDNETAFVGIKKKYKKISIFGIYLIGIS